MKRLFQMMRKKKWIFGVLLLFFVAFLVQDGYQEKDISHAADFDILNTEGIPVTGTYYLRRAQDFFTANVTGGVTYKWQSLDTNIITIEDGTDVAQQVQINVVDISSVGGRAGLMCTVTDSDGNEMQQVITIEVTFSINEYLISSEDTTPQIDRVHSDDARMSIILTYGDILEFGKDAATERTKLNLIFGSAADVGDTGKTRWSSDDTGVVSVVTTGDNPHIMAVGTGRTNLNVSYQDGTSTYTDSIEVYVRPELHKGNSDSGELIGTSSDHSSDVTTMENGDKIWIPVVFTNPSEGILDKVTWVISTHDENDPVLVQDSEGNKGSNWEDANLVHEGNGVFRMDAKAGKYTVAFYVKGAYTDFQTEKKTPTKCKQVYAYIDINAKYENKNVTISIDGSYNLSEAFNVSLRDLKGNFTWLSDDDGGGCVEFDRTNRIVTGLKKGTATVLLKCNDGVTSIPNVLPGQEVTVTIQVTDTFSMNITQTNISVGQKITLEGIIGSGMNVDDDRFTWDTTDKTGTYLTMEGVGKFADITGKKQTEPNSPVIITVAWTDTDGVTLVASCKIYVNNSSEMISIQPNKVEMEVGTTTNIAANVAGSADLVWLSANTDMVTITPMNDTGTNVMLTAGTETGTTVVTVLNKDNDISATCLVTISAPITQISIDKGERYYTVLSEGFVFLRASYQPANATSTDLKWDSSDTKVATVDENGMVTLLTEGTTQITVRPQWNPNVVEATCWIIIEENPVTDIETDVTELKMIAGTQYDVKTTVVPANATYPDLKWASDNEAVAKVSGGLITAVSPGDANITVANGEVFKIIKVNVRARLLSIAFTERRYDIKVGSTANLSQAVIFNPSENVNTNLSWSSSDTSVVTVDENGIITGVSAGDDTWAIITCVAEDIGITGAITCVIHVIDQDVPATSVTLSPEEATIHVGETLQINSIFDPVTATYQQMNWSSTDPTLATVDENGLVTALEEGTVNIGAVYKDPITNEVWEPVYCKITILKAHVYVQGVELSPNNMEVFIGQSLPVSPVFTPEDSTDKGVTYQSSNADIANVDETGSVTGVSSGSAVIICRTNEGGYIATCNVKVIAGVSIAVSPTYREIAKGKTFTISKTILPEEYADTPVTWASSNEKIATVTKNGKVKGIKNGECVVSCTLDNYGSKAVCQVKVAALRTTISLNKTNIRIGTGQTYRLKATVWSNNSTTPSVKWTTSNRKIARVGQKGLVRAKKVGYATITATTTDTIKKKATCRVRVIKRATGVVIRPNYAICYVGRTKKLTAVVKPKTATIKTVSWKTSDKNIAAVTSGVVRGISAGTVNITATTKDGSQKKAVCVVKVLDEVPATSIVVAQTELTLKRGDTAKLSYTVLPNNTSDSLKFASDNKRVATVNSKGTVKAVGTGSCTITIMSSGGTTSTVEVNVVALNRTTLTMRQYDTETLTVNGTTDRVTWYSANASIATVENGKVVGRKKGTTYIYAYVKGCTLACKVTITNIK